MKKKKNEENNRDIHTKAKNENDCKKYDVCEE